jgi:hypothetical protein
MLRTLAKILFFTSIVGGALVLYNIESEKELVQTMTSQFEEESKVTEEQYKVEKAEAFGEFYSPEQGVVLKRYVPFSDSVVGYRVKDCKGPKPLCHSWLTGNLEGLPPVSITVVPYNREVKPVGVELKLFLAHGEKGVHVNVPRDHKLVSCYCNQKECLHSVPNNTIARIPGKYVNSFQDRFIFFKRVDR